MSIQHLPSLTLGQHQVPYPIIQGGMGIRISGARLASAVANTGGIGIISAVGLGFNSPYYDRQRRRGDFFEANRKALIDEIQKARELSPNGIIGVNILVAARDYPQLARTAAQHGANLIIAGAGLPLQLPEYTAESPDVALVPIVSGVRAAQIICRKWKRTYGRLPDGFIVECPKTAGGHLGAKYEDLDSEESNIEQVIPQLVAYLRDKLKVNIPVIAAGGVWDRADIKQMLALGASGVQLGTRFITTEECDADPRYKEFHLQAQREDVVIVPSPVGLPGRALRNEFAEAAIASSPHLEKRCIANCLKSCACREQKKTYCIIQALDKAARGDIEDGLVFAGSNAGRANAIVPVADLMAELTALSN
ncbi:nitronate monooxygenase family protein [Spirulina sp. CS-785/01]|uniref:NAD(P)H-dependent flavin oxidoreductase n=1 Tax=Spirulina sp. CS-785/01 TaxID=3021716 RepID=UPI00232DF108|nr:nitronate monooxygenase family protein [Spirulina sp. CS-785/01]MDB9314244.1 nitronate monooxygenase family protein [Spirulina sp. CS-785/01]